MSSKPREEKLTGRRVRRNYTEEFRRDAVGMIEREGLTAAEVSRRLGVNVNLLRKWREKYGREVRWWKRMSMRSFVSFGKRTVVCGWSERY